MIKQSKTTIALLATTLSACTPVTVQQWTADSDDDETVICKNEAPIDSHIKVFNCRMVNKVNVVSGNTAMDAAPDQEVQVPEGRCGGDSPD